MSADPKSPSTRRDNATAGRSRVRRIGSLVDQLFARRGYAQVAAAEQLHQVVSTAVGRELASSFCVGNLRRGVLQIHVSDSVALQELNFQKRTILRQVQDALPDGQITDLRFRIQT